MALAMPVAEMAAVETNAAPEDLLVSLSNHEVGHAEVRVPRP